VSHQRPAQLYISYPIYYFASTQLKYDHCILSWVYTKSPTCLLAPWGRAHWFNPPHFQFHSRSFPFLGRLNFRTSSVRQVLLLTPCLVALSPSSH
jgi:hypothetical protein